MTRHHAESNINILLTRNLPIDSGVQTVRPCFNDTTALSVAKSNNRTRGQVECDVTSKVKGWKNFGRTSTGGGES